MQAHRGTPVLLGLALGGLLFAYVAATNAPAVMSDGSPARATLAPDPSREAVPGVPPSALTTPADPVAARATPRSYSRAALLAIIRRAFRAHGLDAERAIAVAECESRLDPSAVGDGGDAVGIWQFWPETFASAARRLYGRDVGDLRRDPVVSSAVAAAKIAYDGDWSAWSCARVQR